MNYDNDIIDSERDDGVPRRFRRTSSCGSERTCGATDCVSCYPAGTHRDDDSEHGDEEDRTFGDCFKEAESTLTALARAVSRPADAHLLPIMIGQAQGMFRNGLGLLQQKLDDDEASDAEYVKIAQAWLERAKDAEAKLKVAEAELVTLRHVHRPIVIFAEGVTP